MANMTILQGPCAAPARIILAIVLCMTVACAAADGVMTTRQREILDELQAFRPPWLAEAGTGTGADEGGGGPWMLGEWDSDAGLGELVGLPYGSENAASRFKLLEELYPSEKEELERDGAAARGVDALLEAADMGECRLIPDYYPAFDSTEAKQPDFQVMRLYLQGLLRRAEAATGRGDMREAERCYRAAMLCGRHLTRDKSSSVIYVTGLIFKVRGAQGYAAFLLRNGDGEKAVRVKVYAERVAAVMRAFIWKSGVALSEMADFACLPAVIRVARSDAEVFWRKEAVVRLATLRYGVPDENGQVVHRGPVYEQAADDALSAVVASDPDESVRRLAIWAALNVSPREYARMRHEFR